MSKKKEKPSLNPDDFDEFDPYAPTTEDMLEGVADDKKLEAYAEIDRRKAAYVRVFSGKGDAADVNAVMRDLAWFGRLHTSTYRPDARDHALLEGRREVVQRIMNFTRLDRDALFKIYTGSQ